MLEEIKSVTAFFSKWLSDKFDQKVVNEFKNALESELLVRFKGHWYPSDPQRGQAFRSILIDGVQTDPLLMDIASRLGINLNDFENCLPRNCVVFIDPYRAVCKDLETGRGNSYHVIYQGKPEANNDLSKTLLQQKEIPKGVLIVSSSN
ncbi:hypothetical protein NAEGRDRAFT_81040 [Naegleria gruberi]|uniref:Uncharacterized protein AM59 n=1 Tax=Naegleria gruberi TaxID=5762 RepID=D2VS75_NAEGR|nr:uncharacterized protein NAEGRDRAFT_81040 [Naegleria gruberi]EFC40376.1 hypothetical protein NAEGRDRAFT_81040 [Naegleria gruberi]|eukprot:XP_002673120.1 hypothetical protein NAEGRDRAFT_81040 [Naegleria gruberi strain NEG-M]